ncbi:MAG: histidine kinase [Hyphomicrobiaceae bacterium]|nr:histidine kinase [Hyphomicrobiaceae bacterium]
MPLHMRLSLMIWGLLLGGFTLIILMLFIEAGPRVRAETEAVMRLTRDFLHASVGTETGSGPTRVALEAYVERLARMRHVTIAVTKESGDGTTSDTPVAAGPGGSPWPAWLVGKLWQEPNPIVVPLRLIGGEQVAIRISPRPEDEFAEVAEALATVSLAGAGVALGVLLLTGAILARALTPLADVAAALRRLEAGDYTVTMPPQPQREFEAIVGRINTLAAALMSARLENQRLNRRLVEIQDEERREIAGELHDELGPWLFSVRAEATGLRRDSERPSPSMERIATRTATILTQVEAIQDTNRRVLRKLYPAGLDELGLAAAIEGLVAGWRSRDMTTTIDLEIDPAVRVLDKTQTLTIYRVVQEGLTNTFRHAGAERIEIRVRIEPSGEGGDELPRQRVLVEIADDGTGPGLAQELGYGLSTMRERIEGLSGAFAFNRRDAKGAVLRAVLPIDPDGQTGRGVAGPAELHEFPETNHRH